MLWAGVYEGSMSVRNLAGVGECKIGKTVLHKQESNCGYKNIKQAMEAELPHMFMSIFNQIWCSVLRLPENSGPVIEIFIKWIVVRILLWPVMLC